jgi:hypothetical protein
MQTKNRVPRWVILAAAILLIIVMVFVNALSGNPISKALARHRTLAYYEQAYGEKFTVYSGYYNFKIPTYVFEMGPTANPDLRFDTALFTMDISDMYGGVLAGVILADDIHDIIAPRFPQLDLTVMASEEPLTGYANEDPDYFQTDPELRRTTNHFSVLITWIADTPQPQAFQATLDEMRLYVTDLLPYTTPNLQLIGVVRDSENIVLWRSPTALAFPTF